jgi:membrane protease YdiL (CAAX protease family)
MVIALACAVEVLFRLLSPRVHVDGLVWTLIARLIQGALILGLAFDACGVRTQRPAREAGLGALVSAVFGVLVIACELCARAFMHEGLLDAVLVRRAIGDAPVYLACACVVGPFVEELFFRGLLYSWLRAALPAWVCVAATSVLFASLHGGLPLVQLSGGLIFALLFEWRRNVWPSFVVHASANAAMWLLPQVCPFA